VGLLGDEKGLGMHHETCPLVLMFVGVMAWSDASSLVQTPSFSLTQITVHQRYEEMGLEIIEISTFSPYKQLAVVLTLFWRAGSGSKRGVGDYCPLPRRQQHHHDNHTTQ
jgi:hypothetical protein